jgi:hypothetical protein
MPSIDVSDLLLDGEIAGETFTVLRRRQVVNGHGNVAIVTTVIPDVIGSITPTGDQSIVRAEAYQTQANTIKVITPFLLRGISKEGGNSFLPDVVVWSGVNYEVKSLNDWARYGSGFMEAECVSIDLEDEAPT